ncbi:TetR/AcrR family transcriptional regulator C-terminal domain-containing protein [Nocardioides fonticola]|uniref:TetR/AcrR family transcriptional regulator C-terminal domain-containing protein n=1 Tax=Nocardioides fonticola TaxID=450363 RepID=A0ABP7XCJ8_9ACTN
MPARATRRPRSSRPPLTRDAVIDAALAHLEDGGLGTLTMRELGKRLRVEAMSLYRHVPGKDELLDAIVERLIDDMHDDPEVPDAPTDGWEDFLRRLAHGVRRVALAHPKAFPLVASRPPEAPWLRPPLRSLAWVETFLAGLRAEGFDDRAAVDSYRAFTGFLLGNLLLEVSARGADIGPLDVMDGEDPDPPDDPSLAQMRRDFPVVASLRPLLRQDRSAEEFEIALEELIERIAAIRSGAGA